MQDFIRTRKLTRAIGAIEKARDQSLQREHTNQEGMEIIIATGKEIAPLTEELDRLITKRLVKKTIKQGIEIPKDCWHYAKDPLFPGFAPLDWYLQESGQRTVAQLIKKDHRDNIEWWVKVLTPILSLIVGILGLFVTGLTVWLAWPRK